MSSKVTLLFSLCLLFYVGKAFNITEVLSQNSDFCTFNNYLTQTQVAGEINSRRSITVLVVENDALVSLSTKPIEFVGNILSMHVLLDYYDVERFQTLPSKTSIITTLFQTNGVCEGLEGFLNATDLGTGSVVIGSAVAGSTVTAKLVKSVAEEPYNISVLQISRVIFPNSIKRGSQSPRNSPAPGGLVPPGTTPNQAPSSGSRNPTPPRTAPNSPWPPSTAPKNSRSPGAAPRNSWPPGNAPRNTGSPAPPPKDAPAPGNAPRNSLSPGATPENAPASGNAPKNSWSPGSTPENSPVPSNAPKSSAGMTPRLSFVVVMIIVICALFQTSVI